MGTTNNLLSEVASKITFNINQQKEDQHNPSRSISDSNSIWNNNGFGAYTEVIVSAGNKLISAEAVSPI